MVHDLVGNKGGAYNVNLQFTTGRCAATIACGQTLAGAFPGGANTTGFAQTQQDSYGFTAVAGEAVLFAAVPTSGTALIQAQMFGPNGQSLAFSNSNSTSGSVILAQSGRFTILVRTNSGSGPYNLNLQFTTGRCAQTIACGQTLNAVVPNAGNQTGSAAAEHDTFKFDATAGEAVAYAVSGTSGSLSPIGDLYTPSGRVLLSATVGSTSALTESGTYTVLVRNLSAGSYNINLQFTTGRCAASIACGQTLAGTMPGAGNFTGFPQAQQDSYVFSATAAEAVAFAAVATSPTGIFQAQLFDPAGRSLAFSTTNSRSSSIVLPTSGTYTMLVRSHTLQAGGYNLNLQFTTGRCAQSSIACGQTLGGSIPGSGNSTGFAQAQEDAYRFTATTGEAVSFAAIATSGAILPFADLFSPSGRQLGTSQGGGNPSASIPLPETGAYTLLVRDQTLNKGGGYNLNLQFTTGRCSTAICNQTLRATIPGGGNLTGKPQAQQDGFSFAGHAADAITFGAVATLATPQLLARAQLFGPTGVSVSFAPTNGSSAIVSLPATGIYTIVVHDLSMSLPGDYAVTQRFTTGACTSTTADATTGAAALVAAAHSTADGLWPLHVDPMWDDAKSRIAKSLTAQ